GAPPSVPAQPAPPQSAPAQPTGVQAAPSAPAAAVAPAPASSTADEGDVAAGAAQVRFEIGYRPVAGEDEESWDLYLYLDGSLLAWVPPAGPLGGEPVTFQRTLAPGRHVVRALQERHERSGRNLRHRARVQPHEWVLEIGEGSGWVVRYDLKEARFRPVGDAVTTSWDLLRGAELRGHDEIGEADFGAWSPLCEELETAFDPAGKVPRALRSDMARCVRWAALWPGRDDLASRSEVRDLLARYDYRPKPADAR
ncbi:MAG: hypothetical protein KDD11_16390, partial [Acidobacteria bacterium]|nr:hypothetical protein [Acidobacteriota bacterium]